MDISLFTPSFSVLLFAPYVGAAGFVNFGDSIGTKKFYTSGMAQMAAHPDKGTGNAP